MRWSTPENELALRISVRIFLQKRDNAKKRAGRTRLVRMLRGRRREMKRGGWARMVRDGRGQQEEAGGRRGWRAWPGGLWQVSNEKEKEELCFRDTRTSESEQARSKKERGRERKRKK